ncbi:MAG: OsmC family protein [Candidatus Helarchaeota archaeon]
MDAYETETEMKHDARIEMEENMIFKCNFDLKKFKSLLIDEQNNDPNDMVGPDPARLLMAAVAGCLSASFVYCMNKKNLELDEFTANTEIIKIKNENGLWRVKEINVELIPKSDNEKIQKRIKQCSKIFEKTCVITPSVREGITINVNVNP